jgi:hypothetical protein
MEAISVALLAGALAGLGYLVRRLIERSGETERLERQALALDVERKRWGRRREEAAVQIVVLVLPRE